MSYEVIRLACDNLTYREKMKLAQYLIQAAIKEEETLNPQNRSAEQEESLRSRQPTSLTDTDLLEYVKERLAKSKPSKKQTLSNFVSAMFQFQGGINSDDVEKLISKLEKSGFLRLEGNKVIYA
jgi:aminopeptidase N